VLLLIKISGCRKREGGRASQEKEQEEYTFQQSERRERREVASLRLAEKKDLFSTSQALTSGVKKGKSVCPIDGVSEGEKNNDI